MTGVSEDGWHLVVGQPAIEIREEKQIEEWERSKAGWSGCGKHPTNWTDHKKLHLSQQKELGSGSYGIVQRITYGAVTMARKHVIPRGGLTVDKLREEANAMEELVHKHILKLVGTYTLKRKHLYLLLYPAATCDLSTFLEDIDGIRSDTCADRDDAIKRLNALGLKTVGSIDDLFSLRRTLPSSTHGDSSILTTHNTTALGFLQQLMGCIAEALIFVHDKGIRHRDLKPKNILLCTGRVYLADFGIARDVRDAEDSITCGRYGTASWIAPEVYDGQDHHMSPADMFSLGCIFLNIATVLYGDSKDLASFDEVMKEKEWPKKYAILSNHLGKLQSRAIGAKLVDEEAPNFNAKNILGLVNNMLSLDPEKRPTAQEVNLRLLELGGLDQIYHLKCCHKNNDCLSEIINTKLKTVIETHSSSLQRISELEAENRNLQDRLSFLELNHNTWEARLENEHKYASKQYSIIKEKYEKEVETRKFLEISLKKLEHNGHKRHSSRTRGRNKLHGIMQMSENQAQNTLAVKHNLKASAQYSPDVYFVSRSPSYTNLNNINSTLPNRPSQIPLPTRSLTPITPLNQASTPSRISTPNRPTFPSDTGSGTSTLVSSTLSLFSNRSGKTAESVSSVEDGGETLRLSPPSSPVRQSDIGRLPTMKNILRSPMGDVKNKEKEKVKPTWANMVAKRGANAT